MGRAEVLPYFRGIRDVSRRVSTDDPTSSLRPVLPKTLDEGDNESDVKNMGASVISAVAVPWILLALALVGILSLAKTLRQRKKQLMHYQNQGSNDNNGGGSAGDEEAPPCLVAVVPATVMTGSFSLEDGDGEETKSLVNASSPSKSGRKQKKSRHGSGSSNSSSASSEAKKLEETFGRIFEENEESGKQKDKEGEEMDDFIDTKTDAKGTRKHKKSDRSGTRKKKSKGEHTRSVEKIEEGEQTDDSSVKKPSARRLQKQRSERKGKHYKKGSSSRSMIVGDEMDDLMIKKNAAREMSVISAVTDSVAKKTGAIEMSEGQDSFDARLRQKMKNGGRQHHSMVSSAPTQGSFDARLQRGQDSFDARPRQKMSRQDSRQRGHSTAGSASAVGSDTFDDRLRKKMEKRDSRRDLDGQKKKEGKRTHERKSSNEVI